MTNEINEVDDDFNALEIAEPINEHGYAGELPDDGDGRVVVAFSGGKDSLTSILWLMSNDYIPIPVFIDYGQKASVKEYRSAKNLCKMLKLKLHKIEMNYPFETDYIKGNKNRIDDASTIEEDKKAYYFPWRNGMIIANLVAFAEYHNISCVVMSTIRSEWDVDGFHFMDSTLKFVEYFNILSQKTTINKVKILNPVILWNAVDVVNYIYKFPNGIKLWSNSWSCAYSGKVHCGKCSSCISRKFAIWSTGLLDETVYADNNVYDFENTNNILGDLNEIE